MQIEHDCHGYLQGDVFDAGFLDHIFKLPIEKEEVGKEAYDDGIGLKSGGMMIRWEDFEAIGKLYKALTQQVGEYSIKLAIQNLNKRQLFISQQYSEGWVDLDNNSKAELKLDKVSSNHNAIGMGEFGSKRQIEWERTLSCRLYEERWSTVGLHGDEQGMDLLWEIANAADFEKTKKTREENENKMKMQKKKKKKKNTKMNGKNKKKNDDVKRYKKEEEKEKEMVIGQFYCLPALKFSRGRMRLGAGKIRKLAKLAKILKRSFRYL